jgi:hypothetical protein
VAVSMSLLPVGNTDTDTDRGSDPARINC